MPLVNKFVKAVSYTHLAKTGAWEIVYGKGRHFSKGGKEGVLSFLFSP